MVSIYSIELTNYYFTFLILKTFNNEKTAIEISVSDDDDHRADIYLLL